MKLYQYIEELNSKYNIHRFDDIKQEDIKTLPKHIEKNLIIAKKYHIKIVFGHEDTMMRIYIDSDIIANNACIRINLWTGIFNFLSDEPHKRIVEIIDGVIKILISSTSTEGRDKLYKAISRIENIEVKP